MTIIILILFVFLILQSISHFTITNQLRKINRNQHDILDLLEDSDLYYNTIDDELKNIKQSIQNIAYTNRNQ